MYLWFVSQKIPNAVNLHAVLLKYWGYSSFRPLQEEIIQSALDGKDTLALLPTGGGKSICYQVPGMCADGLCIVISPLIALMKDQVEGLRSRGIKAIGIYHGMSKAEIDNAVDNCVYGDIKFLYMSPERLKTELIRSRIHRMKVSLLAVDEAHCISQWGYDFRPPYLEIAEIRALVPNTPVLALTATATKQVVSDIQEKLQFREGRVFQQSFERKNLAYMVFQEEDKLGRLLRLCGRVPGTGIVYVRNRKRTREIADWLKQRGVSADYYHAGLDSKARDARQDAWMKERTRLIVSTNAFGMGIDKPNVRFVVHMDLPDSPEAYFQEAGRAGRDGKKAYAVVLHNQADLDKLQQFHERSFPPIKEIKKVYNSLGNYYQLAMGSGKDQQMPFDMMQFSRQYDLDPFLVFSALGFLEREGYLALSEAFSNPSRIMFSVSNEDLYRFQVANPGYDGFIKLLLRSYSGLFTEFTKIRETDIARRTGTPEKQVVQMLEELDNQQILHYKAQNKEPIISFLVERLAASELVISREVYQERKLFSRQRMRAMMDYVQSDNKCRSLYLLAYFGELGGLRCGQCDVCLEMNKSGVSSFEFNEILNFIQTRISSGTYSLEDLVNDPDNNFSQEKMVNVIRYLKDGGHLEEGEEEGNLKWTGRGTLKHGRESPDKKGP